MAWSTWDIGCCCTPEVCGCVTIANYEDDFASGTLDGGWTADATAVADGDIAITGGKLRIKDNPASFPGLTRCCILPELTGKKIVLEFTAVKVDFLSELQINVVVWGDPGTGSCVLLHQAGFEIIENFVWSVRTLHGEPLETDLSTSGVDGVVFKIEMTLSGGNFTTTWFLDGTSVHSEVNAANTSDEPAIIELTLDWSTRDDLGRYTDLDDMTFGVYDV